MEPEIQKVKALFTAMGDVMKHRFIAEESRMIVQNHFRRDYR
jgi:hypothetical protein